jgi:soluble lytic murein transglycosylase-like protein/AraC-like DNA-binding protein
MDLLVDSSHSDRVSEFLRILRVRSTIYCRSDMSAPWGFRVMGSAAASFHVLLAGEAWLEIEGVEPMHLHAGDIVILPHGDDHQVRDTLTSEIEFLDDILDRTPPVAGHLRYGGSGPTSKIICGGFVAEDPHVRPLLRKLPPVLRSPGKEIGSHSVAAPAVTLVEALTHEGAPASAALANRLAEILLASAIREHAQRPPGESWFMAVAEPAVAAAIRMIHDEPEHRWTVDGLARRVGMSRSAFSARFRAVTDDPPMTYVRKSRLGRAARYLVNTNWALAHIARRTGYDSDVALSKAFKKQFGIAPSDYRTAALEFDTLAAKYPASADAAGAGYWSGRAWASAGDSIGARARWEQTHRRHPLSYYALLSSRRLGIDFGTLPEPQETIVIPLDVAASLQRASLLERLGLEPEARYEYDRLAADAEPSAIRMLGTASAFLAQGLAPHATQLGRRALTRGAPTDARTYRLLYPLAYADLVRTEAESRRVDYTLVAALIRQESSFDPRAVSRVGAAGLMQIMPEVGRKLAASHGLRGWRDPLLRHPELNLQLGTAHLANLVRQYRDVTHALAAYNAGSGRVARWLTKRGAEDPEVFVERIPFAETRDYVRIVERNRAIYRALYDVPLGNVSY